MSKVVCSACKIEMDHIKAKENLFICPNCNKYMRVSAIDRINMIADPNTFKSFADDLKSGNPLEIPGYEEKLQKAMEAAAEMGHQRHLTDALWPGADGKDLGRL